MLRLGLIGQNIAHSVSPLIHKTLLAHTSIDGDYRILDVPAESLPNLLVELSEKNYGGVNVTVPHKQAVLPLLKRLSPVAQTLGAVNTIVFSPLENGEGHSLYGDNTDVAGFWQSVPESQKAKVPGCRVLLLGAGGAARAILAAILQNSPQAVTIAGQSPERLTETVALAQRLCQQLSETPVTISSCELKSGCDDLSAYDWVINATPIGTGVSESPLSAAQIETLPEVAFVSDLVYYPRKTQLLKYAETSGRFAHNGLDMLIYQAMAAFSLWTGETLDEQALLKVRAALE